MKLRLNNLVYTTDDEVKIQRLLEMGAETLEGGKGKKKVTTKIGTNSNLENLTVQELEALLDEKGIDRKGATKKADLIGLLK